MCTGGGGKGGILACVNFVFTFLCEGGGGGGEADGGGEGELSDSQPVKMFTMSCLSSGGETC